MSLLPAKRREIFLEGERLVTEAMTSFIKQRDSGRSASMNSGLDAISFSVDAIISMVEEAHDHP